jgi:serine/threonine protein phosphatase PrpC
MSILGDGGGIAPGIALGYCGLACGKLLNEDFFDCGRPDLTEAISSGLVFALSDGMSGGAGRRASETCVRAIISDFYAAPESWEIARKLEKIIAAVNNWLLSHNLRGAESQSMLATLSVLVLHHDTFHVAHVGDSRIYRLRQGHYECMTTDHVWPRGDMRHVLRRAVGLDQHLVVDCFSGELQAQDRFVLMSDGVWEVLGDAELATVMLESRDPQALAEILARTSADKQRVYYGRNDATAAVVAVETLPFFAQA